MTEHLSGFQMLELSSVRLLLLYTKALDNLREIRTGKITDADPVKIYFRYVKGIVLAKLESQIPPFAFEDGVVCIRPTQAIDCIYDTSVKETGREFCVRDITYDPNHGWLLAFSGHSDFELHKAQDFKKVV